MTECADCLPVARLGVIGVLNRSLRGATVKKMRGAPH